MSITTPSMEPSQRASRGRMPKGSSIWIPSSSIPKRKMAASVVEQ